MHDQDGKARLVRSVSDSSSFTYEELWKSKTKSLASSHLVSDVRVQAPIVALPRASDLRIKQLARETRQRQLRLQERAQMVLAVEEKRRKEALKRRKDMLNQFDRVWECNIKPKGKPKMAFVEAQHPLVPRPPSSPARRMGRRLPKASGTVPATFTHGERAAPLSFQAQADVLGRFGKLSRRFRPPTSLADDNFVDRVLVAKLPMIGMETALSSVDDLPYPEASEQVELTVQQGVPFQQAAFGAKFQEQLKSLTDPPSSLEQRRLLSSRIRTVRLPGGGEERRIAGQHAEIASDCHLQSYEKVERRNPKPMANARAGEKMKQALSDMRAAIFEGDEVQKLPVQSKGGEPATSFTLQAPLHVDQAASASSGQNVNGQTRQLMQRVRQIMLHKGLAEFKGQSASSKHGVYDLSKWSSPQSTSGAPKSFEDTIPSSIQNYVFTLTEQLCQNRNLVPHQIANQVETVARQLLLPNSVADSQREGKVGARLSSSEASVIRTSTKPLSAPTFNVGSAAPNPGPNVVEHGPNSYQHVYHPHLPLQTKPETKRSSVCAPVPRAAEAQAHNRTDSRPTSPWIKSVASQALPKFSLQSNAAQFGTSTKLKSSIPVPRRSSAKATSMASALKGAKATLPWQAQERDLHLSLQVLNRALSEKLSRLQSINTCNVLPSIQPHPVDVNRLHLTNESDKLLFSGNVQPPQSKLQSISTVPLPHPPSSALRRHHVVLSKRRRYQPPSELQQARVERVA